MKRTIEARKSIDWQVKLKSLESQNPFNTLQQTLGKRSSSVIKGGYSAVTLRNIESKTTILPDLPGHPTEAINSIIDENPVIQTGLDAKYANGKLKVDYSVKLFDDITGEYRLAMYLVEKVFIG